MNEAQPVTPSTEPLHRIRLRGPWQLRSAAEEKTENAVEQSGDWLREIVPLLQASSSTQSWLAERSFNAPTGLDASQRLLVAVQGLHVTKALLNGIPLAPLADASHPFEITSLVQPRNVLQLTFCLGSSSDSDALPLSPDVALEIYSRA